MTEYGQQRHHEKKYALHDKCVCVCVDEVCLQFWLNINNSSPNNNNNKKRRAIRRRRRNFHEKCRLKCDLQACDAQIRNYFQRNLFQRKPSPPPRGSPSLCAAEILKRFAKTKKEWRKQPKRNCSSRRTYLANVLQWILLISSSLRKCFEEQRQIHLKIVVKKPNCNHSLIRITYKLRLISEFLLLL